MIAKRRQLQLQILLNKVLKIANSRMVYIIRTHKEKNQSKDNTENHNKGNIRNHTKGGKNNPKSY